MKGKLLLIGLMIQCGLILGQTSIIEYDEICYCSGKTPHSIIGYDNNLQLILAVRQGMHKNELDSLSIPYTDSQLKLLEIYNLVRIENQKYYTNIPILDEKQASEIRTQSKQIAEIIIPIIEKDIEELVSYLNSTFSSKNAFSIILSYVLDGLVWKEFEKKGLIKPRGEGDANIPWTGHFWMIASPRKGGYGTNTESNSNVTISITNGVPWQFIRPLYNEYEVLMVMLNDISKYGKVDDPKVQETFGMYDLFDDSGNITVPVVFENDTNRIFLLAQQLANKISNQVLMNTSFSETAERFQFKNEEQAIIIEYHEIMWDIFSDLEKQKIIVKPEILKSPYKSEINDMADLIFFIVKN